MDLNNTNITSQIMSLFPEIKEYYGPDVVLDLEVDINAESPKFFTIDPSLGYQVGHDDKATVKLLLKCSNVTTPQELAVEFDMTVQATVNFTFDSFFLNLNIPELVIGGVTIAHDKIGMYDRDYNTFISMLVQTEVENVNQDWAEPWDLAELDGTFGFLRSMFVGFQVSPFVADEFIFLGFSYFLDENVQSFRVINRVTDRFVEVHGSKFNKAVNQFIALM